MTDDTGLWAICLLTCVLCLASISALEDEFYGVLENELESARLDERRRFARDAPEESDHPPHHGPGHFRRGRMHCCGNERSFSAHGSKEKHENIRSCFSEINQTTNSTLTWDPIVDMFSCERVMEHKRRHICISECIMKKLGTMDDEGNIILGKVKELNKGISETWLRDLHDSAAEKCSSEKVMEIKDETGAVKCNPTAINFKHCIWKEVVLTCPEEHQQKNPFCERVRTSLHEKENRLE